MKKTLQVSNALFFVLTLLINYASNTGVFNNTTIGEISRDYTSLFTPAGYAFAIWGLIYLLLLLFIVYQARSLFLKDIEDAFVLKVGWWFVISCIANCAWVISWLYGYTGLSILFIFTMLISLIQIVLRNRMELWDAPIGTIVFLWWPFVIYSGWVTVASIANVSAYLVKIGWDGFGISSVTWTLIMILIATSINLLVTWRRNMREFALVGAWALIAIAYSNCEVQPLIAQVGTGAAIVLVLSSGWHGLKNYKTNPFLKFQQSRKK